MTNTLVKQLDYDDASDMVNGIADHLGEPVDEHIKPLVIGLIMWGVRTFSSCEGHEEWGHHFPYVDVDKRDVNRLAELVQRQNRPILMDGSSNTNQWVIMPNLADSVRLIPMHSNHPLAEMQVDAVEFGKFLQEYPDD